MPTRRSTPAGRGASRRPKPPTAAAGDGTERLQKVLAAAGVGSRRQCEQLILEGRVEVDRQVTCKLGTRVDPEQQRIRVDGEPLVSPRRLYFMVHKPPGVVSTSRDPAGRQRVIDLIPIQFGRLFQVGRLDMASEGLMLVTNDGRLANRLTHPRYGVEKTYQVEVAGHPTPKVLARLQGGIHLAEGPAHVVRLRVAARRKKSTTLEIVLNEGRNREIRRILAWVGHKVMRLRRVAVGPLRLGRLPAGACRPLTGNELKQLRQAAEQPADGSARRCSVRKGRPR